MEAMVALLVIGSGIWLISNLSGSSSSKTSVTGQPSSREISSLINHENDRNTQSNQLGKSKVVKDGFQPDDHCSCGGAWVKRKNSETGGRFFSCSRYPKCKNSREKVLKERLGDQYGKVYCSRGHHKPTGGTVIHPESGKVICKKCVDKGLINFQSKSPSSRGGNSMSGSNESIFEQKNSKSSTKSRGSSCRNGHLRTRENTYIRPDGSRECRVCKRNARS